MAYTKEHLKPLSDYSWRKNTARSIVLHTTLGNTYQGAYDTLKIRHLSYHYIIDELGKVRELIPIDRSAWHAGVTHKPNLRVRAFFNGENPNRHSIGIAFVRKGQVTITKAQRIACVELIKDIGSRTGVRYTADNIFYHREITSYKPDEVKYYRLLVLHELVGYKDEKDAKERARIQWIIKYLENKLTYWRRKLLTLN